MNATDSSTALMAIRHLEEFGIIGLHLKKSKEYDPASGKLARTEDTFERQVAQADHHIAPSFPHLNNSAVFLLRGKPPPEAGEVLIELTQSWRIEQVEVLRPGDSDAVYAVLCL